MDLAVTMLISTPKQCDVAIVQQSVARSIAVKSKGVHNHIGDG